MRLGVTQTRDLLTFLEGLTKLSHETGWKIGAYGPVATEHDEAGIVEISQLPNGGYVIEEQSR